MTSWGKLKKFYVNFYILVFSASFTNKNGTFTLLARAHDANWFFGVKDVPDPYITFRHYCNSPYGETIRLPIFYTFSPRIYDIGTIELDG